MPPKRGPRERWEHDLGKALIRALEEHQGYDELPPSKHVRLFLNANAAAKIALDTTMRFIDRRGTLALQRHGAGVSKAGATDAD